MEGDDLAVGQTFERGTDLRIELVQFLEISRSTAGVPIGVGWIGLTEGLDNVGDTVFGEDRVEPDMGIGILITVVMGVIRVRFFRPGGFGIHGQWSEVVDELRLESVSYRNDTAGGF